MAQILKLLRSLSWQEHFSDFLLQKQVQGCRPRTLYDYRYHVPRFFAPIDSLDDLDDLHGRVNEYFAAPVAPGTFNIRRMYVKAFCAYLVQEGAIPTNPITFPRRKDEGRARDVPPKVLQKLLSLPDKKTFPGLRNYALLLFSLDTGVRPQEALNLMPGDVNIEAKTATIRKEIAKTKSSRVLPLSPLTTLWLARLLRFHHLSWDNAPVFCSRDGRPMNRDSWSHILFQYSEKLTMKVTPYDLRHSFALYSLREGMSPFALQRIMGHADLDMTKRYLALTGEDLEREHAGTSPLNSLVKKRR